MQHVSNVNYNRVVDRYSVNEVARGGLNLKNKKHEDVCADFRINLDGFLHGRYSHLLLVFEIRSLIQVLCFASYLSIIR